MTLNAQLIVKELRKLADRLELAAPGTPKLGYILFKTDERIEFMDITVKDTDGPLTAIVKFEDIHGHETNPDDVPQWASSAPEVASVTASEDGKTAIVSDYNPGDGVSAATVISCDSTNLAGDVLHFTGTVTVEAGDAVSGDIEFQPFA